jgi:MerR family transcriptional regulator, light-induced transcriptional regulator
VWHVRERKAGKKRFGNLDARAAGDLIEIASDIALIVDRDGVIRDVAIANADFAREFADGVDWLGRPWVEIVTAESRWTVQDLLREGACKSSPDWRTVVHLSTRGLDVPILFKTVAVDDHGDCLMGIGRDLQAMEFTGLIRTHHPANAAAYVDALRARGTTVDTLLLDLLAPTARRLGDLWVEDLCDFTEVTIGLWRLEQLLRRLGSTDEAMVEAPQTGRRALLLPAPGEQHTFGLAVVADFLRRSGWEVSSSTRSGRHDLTATVRRASFDMVGFSLSCENRLDLLAKSITVVRRASRNPSVGIMVGGHVFNEHPELVARVGAEATAANGHAAVLQADCFGKSSIPTAPDLVSVSVP